MIRVEGITTAERRATYRRRSVVQLTAVVIHRTLTSMAKVDGQNVSVEAVLPDSLNPRPKGQFAKLAWTAH